MELMAIRYKMSWVMLTVFKDNAGAMDFYKSLKYDYSRVLIPSTNVIARYTFDETSPCITDPLNEEGHEIMSKSFVKFLAAAKK